MRSNQFMPNEIGGLGIFDLLAKGLSFDTHQPAHQQYDDDAAVDPPPPRFTWLDRLGQWFASQRQNDIEAYLAKSQDVFELEARIRDLERSPRSYM